MFIRKFSHWEKTTFDEYKKCYLQYGGNFSTHPDVLSYIHNNADCGEKYYIHLTSGATNGSVCVWYNKRLANDIHSCTFTSHLCIPVARDELILPVTRERKLYIPFRSKIVSSVNKNIINRNEIFNARRTICLAKQPASFSKKTVQTRNRELNKFLQEGGEVRDQSEFSANDIVEIYDTLFEKRRGRKTENKEKLVKFITTFRENIFGKVLFLHNEPCAFQLITKCESQSFFSLDFINIGIDKSIKNTHLAQF